jgi:hypothetical protein
LDRAEGGFKIDLPENQWKKRLFRIYGFQWEKSTRKMEQRKIRFLWL